MLQKLHIEAPCCKTF